MTQKLLIGCPVKDRAWIMNQWFDNVFEACKVAGVEPEFAFIGGSSSDNTDEIIRSRVDTMAVIEKSSVDVPLESGLHRSWTHDRIHSMVGLRNQLLNLVREIQPNYFLSLDSDILVNVEVIQNLLETIKNYDAVGGRCYMQRWNRATSYGQQTASTEFRRGQDCSGVFEAQVIMAIKLMTPACYNVDYRFHHQGEDVPWSLDCISKGLSLGWDGRVISKHVLEKMMLNTIDERVGF